ncbi:LacI family DNA-binding transcriptional regulator [Saccharothrix deserti]|uniref:LacI family DNA-binding transcriptional regulator n=1 Tax=Saccharothrix deserti TaxID=2593674 RepID=UPI00131A8B7F|nr:LacI family DNA-binding transcriptional regulator [Saccharothrix deserti]
MARRASPEQVGQATVKDVAALAGVSISTVSRVLGGTYPVATATRAKVVRAMRELDFVVNAHARALAGAHTKVVAFVLDDVTGPFHAAVARGVEHQATTEGRLCLLCTTHGDPQRELAVIELMREQQADAVILVGGAWEDSEHQERMTHFARALDRSGSRMVLCGRPTLGPDVPATVVEYDNENGAYAITSHLLSAGHRRIAFLGVIDKLTTTTQRVRGFTEAHRAYGLEPDPGLILNGDFTRASGHQMTRQLLADGKRFTAIFAATDIVAAGVYQALREANLRVPEDVSVVGYDDIPLALDLVPTLTTVHVPHDELGRTAVRLAINRATEPVQHVMLGTHIAVRHSVGPPPTP